MIQRELKYEVAELEVPDPTTPQELEAAVESFDRIARTLSDALAGAQG
ncbi:MAG: hypothetical protein Q4P33_03430 [Flaviflexus sp.]|nr:hypothetical protein [Flaviflexus sp.]